MSISARYLLRGGLLAFLAVGPLVLFEFGVRAKWTRLCEELNHPRQFAYVKRKIVEENRCPRTLILGSSLSYRSLLAEHLDTGEDIPAPTFNFGLAQPRALNIYGLWHFVRRRCSPELVILEISPSLVNESPGGLRDYLPSTLGIETLLTRELWTRKGLGWREVVDSATWDQLVSGRHRVGVRKMLTPGRSARGRKLPSTGELERPMREPLTGEREVEEYEKRREQVANGDIKFQHDRGDFDLLLRLVEEIEASGTPVLIHTPPYSEMFFELMGEAAFQEEWCRDFEAAYSGRSHQWYAPPRQDFGGADYYDWVHLNTSGAERYSEGLIESMSAGGELGARNTCR